MPTKTSEATVTDIKAAKGSQSDTAAPLAIGATQSQIISETTREYLAGLDPNDPPSPVEVERDLLAATNFAFGLENANRQRDNKIAMLRTLTHSQVAQVMLRLEKVVKIEAAGLRSKRAALIGIYMGEGPDAGLYVCEEEDLRRACRKYNSDLTIGQFREIQAVLRESAPWVAENKDRDLIAVGNGIFNYATKELLPFSPDHIFRSKSEVDFDPNAVSPVLDAPDGGTWEVEEWMRSVSDDEEIVHVLWQTVGALLRPHVRWGKSAWFYSTKGNNGKGTLVEMMRAVLGPGRHVSIPLDELGKDFMLEQLVGVNAIIVDENNVGIFIDKAANLKAIETNDVLMINRKGLAAVSYQFWGFMVQCLNEFPKTKDRTGSFYRRQLMIPFEKSFEGVEKKWIKDDFVTRPEVLRYVLKKVLLDMPSYYELSTPAASLAVLDRFKESNDLVRQWWKDCSPEFAWDLLPGQFLYDLYKGWLAKNASDRTSAGRRDDFLEDVLRLVSEFGGWVHPAVEKTRTGKRMDRPEPLIVEYLLDAWVGADRHGRPDWSRQKPPAVNYRWCLVRDGHSPLDTALLIEFREAKAARDDEMASLVQYYQGRGLTCGGPESHAEGAIEGRGCAGCKPTGPDRRRIAAAEPIGERFNRAYDAVVGRGLSLDAEPGAVVRPEPEEAP